MSTTEQLETAARAHRDTIAGHLRPLIGHEFEIGEQRLRVVEFLDDELALVVEQARRRDAVQENLYGAPRRWVPQTLTLRFIDDTRPGINPVIARLLDPEQRAALEALIGA